MLREASSRPTDSEDPRDLLGQEHARHPRLKLRACGGGEAADAPRLEKEQPEGGPRRLLPGRLRLAQGPARRRRRPSSRQCGRLFQPLLGSSATSGVSVRGDAIDTPSRPSSTSHQFPRRSKRALGNRGAPGEKNHNYKNGLTTGAGRFTAAGRAHHAKCMREWRAKQRRLK